MTLRDALQPTARPEAVRIVDIINLSSSAHTLLRERVLAMRAGGMDNRIVCIDGPYVRSLREAGVPVETVHLPRGIDPVKVILSLIEITAYLRRVRPDIVHTHCSIPGIIGRIAAFLARVPIVIHTVHGFHFHDGSNRVARWAWAWPERVAGLVTDTLLSQNHADMEEAVRRFIIPKERLRYIGNGVAVERFQPPVSRSDSGRSVIITCVARMEPVKNHTLLLEAARILVERGARFELWLIGDGPLRASYEALCAKWGLPGTVRFMGYRDDITELLARTDIAVLTSIKEGIPRAVLEAMAMAVPVVATRVGGTREVVREGQTGFTVPLGDSRELAACIERLIADPVLRARLGSRGREVVLGEFSEAKIVEDLGRLYRERLLSKGIAVPATLTQAVGA